MRTVLVIDDAAICRELIEGLLQQHGYRALAASSGPEALAVLAAHVPDLVLLDLGLPELDGIDVLSRMRSDHRLKDVPVIVLSSEADRARVTAAARLGISAFMSKAQFSTGALLQRIAEHVERLPRTPPLRPEPAGAAAAPRGRAANVPTAARASAPGIGPADALPSLADALAGLKAIRPLGTRDALKERLAGFGELKGLSPAVNQVLSLTASPRVSVETVAKAIAMDHAIAAKVLKLANSAVYTRGEPVDSVQKAVVRIGLERIRQAVLNISVVDRFGSSAFEGELDTAQFWEHGIASGIIAAELAHATDPRDADAAFTMGLLHDVGRIVFAEHLGEEYLEVIRHARRLGLPLEQVEGRVLLLNHAEAMETVLRGWNFPSDLVKPVVHHHLSPGNARTAAPQQLAQVLRLGLANRLAHAMLLGSSGNDTVYPTEELCAALGVEASLIARVQAVAPQQTDDVKLTMLTRGSGAAWRHRREHYRAMLSGPFRPLYVSATPQLDAFALLCTTLGDPPDGGPPNIIIAHIASARERDRVSDLVCQAGQAQRSAGLPVVVLSPAGQASLRASSGMAHQPCEQVPTPCVVPRFIAAVNRAIASPALARAA